MFIDKVDIYVKAGNGGNGCVSFRREKYVSHGGPDGGDGGKGGDIVFVIDPGASTLLAFKNRRRFIAANGADGMKRKFYGASGADTLIAVPRGTVIRDRDTGRIIKDMSSDEPFVFLKGGKGGWGNVHFATPTRQVPRFAKSGITGREANITLELKTIADVGLVGYPNAGKSTLLSVISAARPKIADYPFTTLQPQLGVVSVHGGSFVVADIPGLIDGAGEGRGLGHDFLRHIERCRLILHLVDISASERPSPIGDVLSINSELAVFSAELSERPQIIAANKSDIGFDEDKLAELREWAEEKGYPVFLISAATGEGVPELINAVYNELQKLPPVRVYESEELPEPEDGALRETEVTKEGGVYYVTGEWLVRVCGNVNFDDSESLSYFQRVLRNGGVIQKLEDAGIQEGDTVDIYGIQFDFMY
ncbi:MAG: GTPase ObgE [Clostridiales bacterium]|nr:GTPase ObgE [Clostridiales bacterium]